jgi:C4-type Zn-finger protein
LKLKIKAFDKKSSRMVEVFDAKAKAIKTNKPENTVIIKDNNGN